LAKKKLTVKEGPILEESIPLPEKEDAEPEVELTVPDFKSLRELRLWCAKLAPGEHEKVSAEVWEQKKKIKNKEAL